MTRSPDRSPILIFVCKQICLQTLHLFSSATLHHQTPPLKMAGPSTSGGSAWSSALSGKSDDEKEELLDRMLTRLALCDDSKLQDLLAKILPLSIAALSSASAPLRNKVFSSPVNLLANIEFTYFSCPTCINNLRGSAVWVESMFAP